MRSMAKRAYEVCGRILLAAFGLALLVVLLELLTRVADYAAFGAPLLRNYDEESLFTSDNLGRRGRPFARYRKWQLNSQGYRGPEIEKDKIHIICIGSSETFGLYEAPDEEYPRQLERTLNAETGSNNYQVVNVSYPGETLNTTRVRIPEIVSTLHPQYAVIYPSVAYYVWIPWTVHTAPAAGASKPSPSFEFQWRISERLHDEARQYLPAALQNWWREVGNRREARQYGPVTMDRVPKENVEVLKSDLVRLIEELRSAGVRPVLVTHANWFGLTATEKDRYIITGSRRFYPMLREEGFTDMEKQMNAGVREVASEQHVPLIDAATGMPTGEKYFADYEHFTTLGAHVMAEILTAGLVPLLNSGAQAGPRAAAPPPTSSRREASGSLHTPRT